VIDVDVLPTAAISFLIAKTGLFSGGAVISASHSPTEENGIKIFDQHGLKLSDRHEQVIEELFFGPGRLPDEFRPAALTKDSALTDVYVSDMVGDYRELVRNSPKIVIDCANGAGSKLFPQILDRLNISYTVVNASPNGVNINKLAGSEYARIAPEKFAAELLVRQNAYAGFIFDGDADRVVVIDNRGNLYDGNMLLAMLAFSLKKQDKLAENKVVTTKMSNSGLADFFQKNQITTEYTRNGDKYVTELLVEKDLTLGGEAIGHIIVHDSSVHLTGDGLRTALCILSKLFQLKTNDFQSLAPGMQKWPQIKVSIPLKARTKAQFRQIPGLEKAMQSVVLEIGDVTQLECRPASTEPLYRIMLEARYTPVSVLIHVSRRLIEPIQKFFDVVNGQITVTDCVTGKKLLLNLPA
jgi:phosphoglucosamine mutase